MAAIALQRVSVVLGSQTVVWELTTRIGAGEWLGIIGPNGAGKTTVLRAMSGLVRHTGSLTVHGHEVESLGRRELARHVALVPQIPVLPPAMAVSEYVLLGRSPHISYFGSESRADREAAAVALRRLDLEAFADRPLGTLSG